MEVKNNFLIGSQFFVIGTPLTTSWSEIARTINRIALILIVPLTLLGYGLYLFLSSRTNPYQNLSHQSAREPLLVFPKSEVRNQDPVWQEACDIQKSVESLLNNFDLLTLNTILSNIHKFKEKYQSLREPHLAALELVEFDETTLKQVKERYDDLWMIIVPGKGDCLFDSLLRGLKAYARTLSTLLEVPEDHFQLRLLLADYIRENIHTDSRLEEYTKEAIEAHIFVRERFIHADLESLRLKELMGQGSIDQERHDLQEEQNLLEQMKREVIDRNYESYLKLLKKPKFFGSKNAIYAFSCLYPQIRIEIERKEENGPLLRGLDEGFSESGSFLLTLCLKNGNHFDYDPRPLVK